MEEPELRVGGWVQQKKRGKIRRLFSFLLIVIVGLLVGGPMFVDYNAVEVQSSSLYKNAGVWNGPFGQENIKEFNEVPEGSESLIFKEVTPPAT